MPGLIVIIFKFIWLLALIFLLFPSFIACWLAIKACFSIDKKWFAVLIVISAGYISWQVTQVSLSEVINHYSRRTIFESSEFIQVIWQKNLVYAYTLAIAFFSIYNIANKKRNMVQLIFLSGWQYKIFFLITELFIWVSLVCLFSATTQVFIGIFMGEQFFMHNGIRSCIWC